MAITVTASAALADANSLINFLGAVSRLDVISINDQNTFTQLFANAQPMKASVHETSRVMDYPVESGAILSDHRIINPTSIEISFIINALYYSDVYQQMRNTWLQSTALMVQTRTGVYDDMIIAAMPHEEDPEMFDAISIVLSLREVQFIVPSASAQPADYQPLDPTNQPTIARGLQFAQTIVNSTFSVSSYINAASVWGIKF